ncbi:unnamed protein product [Urochloa decumbens]|uniref:BTB domain-containing protein n=1 Tax=Urochloa decumbens TaxID=240449 RepID=A0ABC9FRG0_9POAL
MAAADRKACDILAGPEVRWLYFYFRVSYSATQNLAAGQHVEKSTTSIPGFMCTARCWPHYLAEGEQGWIKLSLTVTVTSQQQAPKWVAARILLRTRTGLLARKAKDDSGLASGERAATASLLAPRDEIEQDCVLDDHFTAICGVGLVRDPTDHSIGSVMFNMPDLSDVAFRVEGETFKAHRLVLAACSPVFRAELFGPMVEGTARSIAIEDMRAPTFRHMLYYMYHSSLPPGDLGTDDASEMSGFQHLFVAADRYGLDRLKETCEEVMCAGVKASTVLPALEFAEENARSPKLKSKCLDFLAVPENFQDVAATDEYLRLMNTFPALLADVRSRCCKRARLV